MRSRTLAQTNKKPHLWFNPHQGVWAMSGWARDLKVFGDWCRAMDVKRRVVAVYCGGVK